MNTTSSLHARRLAVALAWATGAAALLPNLALAHVSVEPATAVVAAPVRLAFAVNHGCNSSPTRALTVLLPPGLHAARPMAKAGWTVTVEHGERVQVRWQASSRDAVLPDAAFDEFVLRLQAPPAPGPVWFEVLQQCEQGQIDWADLPTAGAPASKTPAVLWTVLPAAGAASTLPAEHAGHQH